MNQTQTTAELPAYILAGVYPDTQTQPAPVTPDEPFDPLAGLDAAD